jgi:hypothetical protein
MAAALAVCALMFEKAGGVLSPGASRPEASGGSWPATGQVASVTNDALDWSMPAPVLRLRFGSVFVSLATRSRR